MTLSRLEVRSVCKSWGRLAALSEVNLVVEQGMFVSLLGPSGCGKTTLLRLITGHLSPDSGRILVDGNDITRVPTHRRNMGMVFQSFALFPHLTVAENIAFPLAVRGLPATQLRDQVTEALAMVHLEAYRDAYPRQLSGGQQQRVGLTRAIVYRPTILLLDEPLSNLDAGLREEMRMEISQVTRRLGITAIYVTHDQHEALALSDAIAVMNHGRIVQFGSPEGIYRHPANEFVARFVGYANALPVDISAGIATIAGVGTIAADPLRHLSGPATLFLHASDVRLDADAAPGPNQVACQVIDLAFMGDHVEYVVEHASGLRLKAHAPIGSAPHARSSIVLATLPADKLVPVAKPAEG
jgi:putative spermidine/putrescine transport system ATP-binding protein